MKNINKISATLIALIMILGCFVSCESNSPIKSSEEDLATVMTVGDFEAPYELCRYFFMNFKKQYENGDSDVWNSDAGKDLEKKLDSSVENALRGVYAVLALCEDYDISIDDKGIQNDVQDTIDETVESYGGSKAYKKALGENYMTDSVYRFLLAVDFCETELYNTLIDKKIVDDSDDAALASINGADFIRTVQILIKNDAGDDIEQNRKTAEELLEKIKRGEDMNELIGKYSEDFSMTSDGYYSTHLELIEEYEEAAYKLEIGEVSEVVESHLGFHIIKRLAKDNTYIEKNFDDLKIQYLTSKFYTIIEEEKDELSITKTSLYDNFNVKNMK